VNGATQVLSRAGTFLFRGLGGNDAFNISFNPVILFNPGQVLRAEGGDGSDTLTHTATPGSAVTINLAASTVTRPARPSRRSPSPRSRRSTPAPAPPP